MSAEASRSLTRPRPAACARDGTVASSRGRGLHAATARQYDAFPRVHVGNAAMRVPITLRLEADLLAAARVEAKRDSRTLTNLIEVALKRHLAAAGMDRPGPAPGRDAVG